MVALSFAGQKTRLWPELCIPVTLGRELRFVFNEVVWQLGTGSRFLRCILMPLKFQTAVFNHDTLMIPETPTFSRTHPLQPHRLRAAIRVAVGGPCMVHAGK